MLDPENEDLLTLTLNYLRKKDFIFRLKENISKHIEIEFLYLPPSPSNHLYPATNTLQISLSKNKLFWKCLFKLDPSKFTPPDLSQFGNEKLSIYPHPWKLCKHSNLLTGGLKRCIYTIGNKDYFNSFISSTHEYFQSQSKIFHENLILTNPRQ